MRDLFRSLLPMMFFNYVFLRIFYNTRRHYPPAVAMFLLAVLSDPSSSLLAGSRVDLFSSPYRASVVM
jgi:hypothetical protein